MEIKANMRPVKSVFFIGTDLIVYKYMKYIYYISIRF
jgi:hypothetical protein